MTILFNNKYCNNLVFNLKNNYIHESLSPKRKNKVNLVNVYEFLINNNYNIKKFNFTTDNQELYFVNNVDNSAVVKIICKDKYHLTIPLKNCNYEFSTVFNNIDRLFEYLKFHINND